MLSLSPIVEVRVSASPAPASPSAFSAGLILAPSAGEIPEEDRLRVFASAADMLAAGFTPASPAYLAALAYFAASPAPDRVLVGLYPAADDPAAGLRAVLDATRDFYGVFVCADSSDALIPLAEAVPSLPGRFVLFCGAAGSVSDALSESGLLKKAFATGSDRILTVYGCDLYAPAALMGTAMGLSRAWADSAFALCYHRVPGMLPTDLTESRIADLKAVNANVYITRGASRLLLENGTVVSGKRFDEVHALDRIAADLQEAALEMITSESGRLPQTDETSAAFINRFSAVLSAYTARGILAAAPWRGRASGSLQPGDVISNGYLLWADSYDQQSDADRAAHKAMPIHAALCLSGSVETLVIDVDVSL